MLLAHKIKLDPTKEQEVYFSKACGVARFAYNWALGEWKKQYKLGEKTSEAKLRKQLNSIKHSEFPWMLEVTKCAPQQAIKNLGSAYKNAFRKINQGVKNPKEIGFPQFKKKGVHDSFKADNGAPDKLSNAVKVEGKKVKLPICGWVKMREEPRFAGRIISTNVSKQADGWYISLQIDTEYQHKTIDKAHDSIGVDLGMKALATLSTGEVVQGAKPYKHLENRIRRLNKSLHRKKIGSANRAKAKTKLAKLHLRIANIRKDCLHKLTHKLVTSAKNIGIEDLNVKGMIKNGRIPILWVLMLRFELPRDMPFFQGQTSGQPCKMNAVKAYH